MASLAGCLSQRGLPTALIGAPFELVVGRSVRGVSLQAATMGLLPPDGCLRIAPGHHPVGSCRHSRGLHDLSAVAAAPAELFKAARLQPSRTSTDSRAQARNLENRAMLLVLRRSEVRGASCEDTQPIFDLVHIQDRALFRHAIKASCIECSVSTVHRLTRVVDHIVFDFGGQKLSAPLGNKIAIHRFGCSALLLLTRSI